MSCVLEKCNSRINAAMILLLLPNKNNNNNNVTVTTSATTYALDASSFQLKVIEPRSDSREARAVRKFVDQKFPSL